MLTTQSSLQSHTEKKYKAKTVVTLKREYKSLIFFVFRTNTFIKYLVQPFKDPAQQCVCDTVLLICMVKPTRCINVSNLFYFGMTLYMFRTVFPSIIMSSRLYIQQHTEQAYVKQILPSLILPYINTPTAYNSFRWKTWWWPIVAKMCSFYRTTGE